ncbi:hypothetical protein PIB30_068820 [Stylosanthes scabra]|uniref:Uncharacterized protein n=1 Tax=Stylosanthes scabra TaxID=79078 RepID=A0ABU6SPJ4_9FABA|nr:hypothetical protein [Stylosanthes scabra]
MGLKVHFLVLLCIVLPATVSGIRIIRINNNNPFTVKGRVYCDPCRFSFESIVTTYIAGAEVILQCKDRITNGIVLSKESKTDSSGEYKINVDAYFENHVCDVKLLRSSQEDCKEPTLGRDKSRVILNRFNGISNNERIVNNLGFMKNEALSGCVDILRKYHKFGSNY